MRKAFAALLLVGCGSDSFTTELDSGGADSAAEVGDALVVEDGGDSGGDALADAGSGDAGKDAPTTCSLSPAPVTAFDGDQCSAVVDPGCGSACTADGGVASQGYVCKPSITAGDIIPEWLRPSCFVSPTDAGAGKHAYCCARAVCVRLKANDGLCLQGQRPYAYSCPTGVIALKNCDGGACNCNGTTDSTVQCCDLAGP